MARKKVQVEEDVPAGAPNWMVTFSDVMTLLLTFFVLLLSFATFQKETVMSLGTSFSEALSSVGKSELNSEDSMWQNQQIKNMEKVTKGSETRVEKQDDISKFMKEKKPLDFRNFKVFTVPSDDFFYGDGAAISTPARDVLDALVVFLRAVPSRVVISENGPGLNYNLGLDRALAVMDYMSESTGIGKENFSITSSTMTRHRPRDRRMLEITLLERSIYE